MKFPNTPELTNWLQRDHPNLAAELEFEVDAARFHAFRKQLHAQGDHKHRDSLKEAEALDQVALFAALTYKPSIRLKVADAITKTPESVPWPYFRPPEEREPAPFPGTGIAPGTLIPELRGLR